MTDAPHVPVLLAPLMARLPGVSGIWVDGTFGAGGYTRALLDAGADTVIAIDQDPEVFTRAAGWAAAYGPRLRLVRGNFADLDRLAAEALSADTLAAEALSADTLATEALGADRPGDTGTDAAALLDGVVLDIGVSSMQIDQADRGFSFSKDGPLDMRMAQEGVSAADLVNGASEADLADILYQYGEERASRRIAKAIVMDRARTPFTTTRQLAGLLERLMPRAKKDQPHPATRSFQALRIAVNDELGALVRGLIAAERALRPGGVLAVVTFHSLEDRIVKRYFASQSGQGGQGNRHQPAQHQNPASLALLTRKAITADADEVAANPRARSAKLRMATRTRTAPQPVDLAALGLPRLDLEALVAGGRS